MNVAAGLLLACSGFLLAVLWMDLIFDSQAGGARAEPLPEPRARVHRGLLPPRDDDITPDEPPDRGDDGDTAGRVGVSGPPRT